MVHNENNFKTMNSLKLNPFYSEREKQNTTHNSQLSTVHIAHIHFYSSSISVTDMKNSEGLLIADILDFVTLQLSD